MNSCIHDSKDSYRSFETRFNFCRCIKQRKLCVTWTWHLKMGGTSAFLSSATKHRSRCFAFSLYFSVYWVLLISWTLHACGWFNFQLWCTKCRIPLRLLLSFRNFVLSDTITNALSHVLLARENYVQKSAKAIQISLSALCSFSKASKVFFYCFLFYSWCQQSVRTIWNRRRLQIEEIIPLAGQTLKHGAFPSA